MGATPPPVGELCRPLVRLTLGRGGRVVRLRVDSSPQASAHGGDERCGDEQHAGAEQHAGVQSGDELHGGAERRGAAVLGAEA